MNWVNTWKSEIICDEKETKKNVSKNTHTYNARHENSVMKKTQEEDIEDETA